MNKELAQDLIDNWDGKDRRFIFEGEIYTEDDVNEAMEFLESLNG